jgi:anti-anti-sigma factor
MKTGVDQGSGGGRIGGGRIDPGEPGAIGLSCRDRRDGAAVIAIRGELDLATSDRTVRYICDVIDRHLGAVSVDLSGLAFCDACGLGALLQIATYAERCGRRIAFTRPPGYLVKIMRITGVDDRLLAAALAG